MLDDIMLEQKTCPICARVITLDSIIRSRSNFKYPLEFLETQFYSEYVGILCCACLYAAQHPDKVKEIIESTKDVHTYVIHEIGMFAFPVIRAYNRFKELELL